MKGLNQLMKTFFFLYSNLKDVIIGRFAFFWVPQPMKRFGILGPTILKEVIISQSVGEDVNICLWGLYLRSVSIGQYHL